MPYSPTGSPQEPSLLAQPASAPARSFIHRLYRLLFGQAYELSLVRRETVFYDDEQIVRSLPNGQHETVRWDDLQDVTIMTTDGGPYSEDVFWILSGTQTGCLIPSNIDGMKELLSRLQTLPGFNHEAILQAMGYDGNAKFPCWKRDDKH